MKPSKYLMGMVLMGMVISGFAAMYSVAFTNHQTENTDFNSTFNQLNTIQEEFEELNSIVQLESTEVGQDSAITAVAKGANSALLLLLTPFSFLTSIFDGLENTFGIPVWFTAGLLTLISIGILFAVITAVFRTSEL